MREAALPFPPGEGPFRVRGALYIDGMRHYDEVLPGGHTAVLARLSPPVRDFLATRFLPSAMYDVFPLVLIGPVAAEIAGRPLEDMVRETAAYVAPRHVSTLFKLLLKVASPEMVALRLPKVTMRYFDFGDAGAEMIAPGRCSLRQSGIPQPLASWYAQAVRGFVPYALEQAGAREVRVLPGDPLPEGERFGIETVTLPFEFRWQE